MGFAQIKRTANWYFGNKAGLCFTDTGVQILNNGQLNTWEGCSSISDEQGNLLLYSDGKTIWNKFHKIVKNGTGLLGDISSTQSALILPLPQNDSIYVLITTPYAYDYNIGMNYSLINIKGNNDSAEVIKKNILLHKNSSEKASAINHNNGKDLWIVGHEYGSNRFYNYLLTKDGFSTCPVYSDVGFVFQNNEFINQCYLKFSQNAKMCINLGLSNSSNLYFELFKFDDQTGKLGFLKRFSNILDGYGAEFSPTSKYIYITEMYKINRVKISNLTYENVFTYNSPRRFNAIQIGLNGKIYLAQNDSNSISTINAPDSSVSKCGFVAKGQSLGSKISQYGLPNFNQSYFYTPAIDYSYQLDCRSNTIELWGKDTFNGNKFQWGLRKLYSNDTFAVVSTARNTSYSFSDTGSMQIRFIAANSTRTDTVLKTLIIYPKVNPHFLGKDTVFASGSIFNKTLASPPNAFCNRWFYKDSLVSSSDSLHATKFGTYTCQSSNQSFCLITDTLVIRPCADTLSVPIILRSRDTLMVSNYRSDSLVWVLNGMVVQKGYKNYYHFTDTGKYYVVLHRALHCSKISSAFAIKTLCLDTLKTPIILRSRDSLFVVNYKTDSLFWFKNGQLIQASKQNNFHMSDTGNYSVEVHRPFHCAKTSQSFAVNSVCIDSLKRPIISQINDSLFVANMKADSLKWYKNGVFLSSSSEAYLNISDTGLYTVEAHKRFLCAKTSLALKVNKLNIAVNEWLTKQVNIFPNPSEGELMIQCSQDFKLKVVDAIGKLLIEQDNLKTLELPQGIYTFYITIAGGTVVKKVVVL